VDKSGVFTSRHRHHGSPSSYITRGMNNRPVNGSGSETSHPIDMINHDQIYVGAGVAQSLLCLTTYWTTGVRPPVHTKGFPSNFRVQTGSGAPPSLSNGYRGPFPGGKARLGRDADHSPHLMPRSRMSRSYASSPP
jgi:hypothetical protein